MAIKDLNPQFVGLRTDIWKSFRDTEIFVKAYYYCGVRGSWEAWQAGSSVVNITTLQH